MNSKEFCDAAERLIQCNYDSDELSPTKHVRSIDEHHVARAFLAEHQSTDDEPITDEWVRSIAPRYWNAGAESYWPEFSLRFAEKIGNRPGGFYFWGEGERSTFQEVFYLPIKTRGQVRLLLRALAHG